MVRAARLFLILSLFLVSYFLSPNPSFAQTKDTTPPSTNVDANVPDNLHNWTQTVMIEVLSALSCQLTGIDPTTADKRCLGADPKTGKIGFLPASNPQKGELGGAIGFTANGISALFTPPIHTKDYIQNLASNFGITKKTYAQATETGTGFDGLEPLQKIWTTFRNIVYLFFVIVFVVIGLAIMLRVKIDPRTVMTIQNQIPKIIIGILFVTFSFAIAGFLIDLMWVVTYLIYNIISQPTGITDFNPVKLQGSSPFGAVGWLGFFTIPFEAAKGIGEVIGSLLSGDGVVGKIISTIMGILTGGIVGGFLALFGIANPIEIVGGAIAFVIIIISLLIAMFRLWIVLIFAYVNVLLSVVLAPFWVVGGIIPGSPINATGWLRNLVANLAAFPAVIGMFMLGKVFIDGFGSGDQTKFLPPLIGDPGNPKSIGAIIGLGIILMTPNVVNMLKAALKAPKTDIAGGAMAGLGAGFGAVKEVGGTAVAYKSKLPEPGKAEGFGGVLKRVFR